MPPVGYEPTIPVSERPQTHALDRTATRIGTFVIGTLKTDLLVEWPKQRQGGQSIKHASDSSKMTMPTKFLSYNLTEADHLDLRHTSILENMQIRAKRRGKEHCRVMSFVICIRHQIALLQGSQKIMK
jgi:hypothetical protein